MHNTARNAQVQDEHFPPPGRIFLSAAEVAALFGMSEEGVRIWIKKGLLPSVRIRQTVRVPRTAIDELLTNSTRQQ